MVGQPLQMDTYCDPINPSYPRWRVGLVPAYAVPVTIPPYADS